MSNDKFYQNLLRYNQLDGYKLAILSIEHRITKLKNKYKHHKIKIGKRTLQQLKRDRCMISSLKIVGNSFYGAYFPISEEGTSIFFCNTENIQSLKNQK